MCTILLSSYVGIKEELDIRPLTLGEWHKFVDMLVENKLEPSIAFSDEIVTLKNLGYDAAFIERVKALVGRGAVVAYIADALIEKIKKKGVAKSIAEGKLLLISVLKPDVGFSAGCAYDITEEKLVDIVSKNKTIPQMVNICRRL